MVRDISHAAEQLFTYKGVTIYHVYKNDDYHDCAREWWFDTVRRSSDDKAFDVRDLAEKLQIEDSQTKDDETFRIVILKAAIDAGLIRPRKSA